MIFADLKVESVVQVADKTRLDATRSFVAKGEADISLVEIQPEAGADFIDVTGSSSEDWLLDWAYATEGEKTIVVRITTDGDPVTLEKTMTVLTEDEDALLSTDEDLISLESDILDYLPQGHSSWKFMHRKAQSLILDYLDRMGYTDDDNDRLTKAAIVEKEEFRTWSKFLVLRMIFFDLSNQPDDNYHEKSEDYKDLATEARSRAHLRLDTDGDGAVSDAEKVKRFDTIRITYQ